MSEAILENSNNQIIEAAEKPESLPKEQATTALAPALIMPWPQFISVNPLASAAQPLLLLISQIKYMPVPNDFAEFYRQTVLTIEEFEKQAKIKGCAPRNILAARYCLCTAIDEMVLCTSWGTHSNWSRQTLLSLVHKETWGGERFFIILEKMAEEGQENIDLLEVIYLILALGYEGKYYNQDSMVRDEIRSRLFKLIQSYRSPKQLLLSPSEPLSLPQINARASKTKLHLIALSTLGVFLLLMLGFNLQTYRHSKTTRAEMNAVGRENPNLAFSRLHQLENKKARSKK